MDFVKRNPILTAVLAVCVLAFAVESYFLWSLNSRSVAAQRSLKSAQATAENAEKVPTSPNADNKAAALKNVDELQASLDKTTATLTQTPLKITNVPATGTDLQVAI